MMSRDGKPKLAEPHASRVPTPGRGGSDTVAIRQQATLIEALVVVMGLLLLLLCFGPELFALTTALLLLSLAPIAVKTQRVALVPTLVLSWVQFFIVLGLLWVRLASP
jgi:hypothetical protein